MPYPFAVHNVSGYIGYGATRVFLVTCPPVALLTAISQVLRIGHIVL